MSSLSEKPTDPPSSGMEPELGGDKVSVLRQIITITKEGQDTDARIDAIKFLFGIAQATPDNENFQELFLQLTADPKIDIAITSARKLASLSQKNTITSMINDCSQPPGEASHHTWDPIFVNRTERHYLDLDIDSIDDVTFQVFLNVIVRFWPKRVLTHLNRYSYPSTERVETTYQTLLAVCTNYAQDGKVLPSSATYDRTVFNQQIQAYVRLINRGFTQFMRVLEISSSTHPDEQIRIMALKALYEISDQPT